MKPEGAALPGAITEGPEAGIGVEPEPDEPEPDEPENGLHGENIASKQVLDDEPDTPHGGARRDGR